MELVETDFVSSIIRAILTGWLMGLLAWLVSVARETISQLIIIWLITAAISFTGLYLF
jgi:formate/nitrite transporter FocA (FNT family)